MVSLTYEMWKANFLEIEGKIVIFEAQEVGEMGSCLSKGIDFLAVGWVCSGDVADSMIIIMNNSLLYTWKLLGK